jgi:hypothetical protein
MMTGFLIWLRREMYGLAFLFDFKDLTPAISSAIRTNLMRGDLGFAVGAGDKMNAAQSVMGAATIAAAFGNLALGMGSHGG